MVQLCVYATTAKKADGLQFSEQVLSFLFSQFVFYASALQRLGMLCIVVSQLCSFS